MKFNSIIVAFLFPATVLAQATRDKEQHVESTVTEVKVFLSGAEEVRTATASLVPGKNTVVLKNITPFVDGGSIQVEGNPDYTISGVAVRSNYLQGEEETEDQQRIREELEETGYQIREKQALIGVHKEELNLLVANQSVAGEAKGLFFEDVLDLSELYRKRIPELQQMIRTVEQQEAKLRERQADLQRQLKEITEGLKRFSGEIVIKLEANRNVKTAIRVKYLTTAAGWYPVYDARSKDVKSAMQFTYKAMVYQSTGHDWSNVKLTLSTSDPRMSHTVPELGIWQIRPQDPVYYKNMNRQAYDRQLKSQELNEQYAQKPIHDKRAYDQSFSWQMDNMRSTSGYTTLQSSGVNAEFAISLPYSIPTNGKSYMVEVQQYDMPVVYRYFSAPKYDADAFLLARITGWEQYSLLSGNANIYYQGTYVGESFVDAQVTSDTMAISLGRDKDIIITRERVKEYCKSATVGSNKKESIGVEITIRNNKSIPVEMDLVDQVPVSREKEIEVSVRDVTGAKHNEETGELNWSLKLEPGKTVKLLIVYEVKYPKEKRISNL